MRSLYPVYLLAGFHLLGASTTTLAQTTPSAGSQLLQIPVPPQRNSLAPELQIDVPRDVPTAVANSEKIVVRSLSIDGTRSVDSREALRASGFVPGVLYSIDDLRAIADKVTAHYRSQGYFLAQTYLPAQDITDGHVRLEVVEGRYGKVQLANHSRLIDASAWSVLRELNSSVAVNDAELERRLLLLSDLPGVQTRSVLTPGATLGTTDLLVELQPGPPVSGSVEVDNEGSRYTGSNRLGASLLLNGLAGIGDVTNVRLLNAGEGMGYGRLSYQVAWGGLQAGLAYTALQYKLGAEFASTHASGTARVGSLFMNYPLLRSRLINWSAQLSVDDKSFSDQWGADLLLTNKDMRGTGLTLKRDYRDNLGLRNSTFSMTWTHGALALRDPAALQSDAQTAQSQGEFDKLALAWSGQYPVASSTAVVASLSGQWSSKNLDASEKFTLGGARGVRAYPAGESSGDEGILISLETRTAWPSLGGALGGQAQWVFFLDAGQVTVNKHPWESKSDTNSRSLSGIGLGLQVTGSQNWMLRTFVAAKLDGGATVSEPDMPLRVWMQLSKLY